MSFKSSIGLVIVVAVIIAGGWYFLKPSAAPTVQLQPEETGPLSETATTETDFPEFDGTTTTPVTTSTPESEETESSTETTSTGAKQYSVTAESSAQYLIAEVLRGEDFMVNGKTNQVAGELTVDLADLNSAQLSEIKVNARTLKTDSGSRDNAVRRFVLKTDNAANEFITFAPTSLRGFEGVDLTTGDLPFAVGDILGELTISGVTKEVGFPARVSLLDDGNLLVTAEQFIKHKDYGLNIPDVPFVADVDEEMQIKVSLIFAPQN